MRHNAVRPNLIKSVSCLIPKKLAGIKSIEYQGEGFKLSLFRYPEDVSPKDQPQQQQPKKSKGSGTRR